MSRCFTPGRWSIGASVITVALLTGCGAATGGTGTANPATTAGVTATPFLPTPTPLPLVALSVQTAWTVTDATSVVVSGSTTPGAKITATGATVFLAVANGAGAFAVRVTGLTYGDNSLTVAADLAGYQENSTYVTIARNQSVAGYKASAAAIPYNQLIKDPAALAGHVVTYKAQVFQYDTATGTSNFIASVTNEGYGIWTDNIWADVDPSIAQNVCNNTVIRFWGSVVGPYTYTTTSNGSLTIPEINIKYISVVSGAC